MSIHQHTYISSGTIAPSGMKHGDHYHDALTSREYIYNGISLIPIPLSGDYDAFGAASDIMTAHELAYDHDTFITSGFVESISIAPSSIIQNGAGLNQVLMWDGFKWTPSVPPGVPGAAGPGVPSGGTINQALVKLSSTDYHTAWTTLLYQGLISVGNNKVLITDGSGNVISHSTVDSTELGYVDGVSANIQTQLNNKQGLISVGNNKVLITDGSGVITASSNVDSTELSYVDGVSANIQTQLNNKISGGLITLSPLLMNTGKLLGRTTASSGSIEEIIIDNSLTLSGSTLKLNVSKSVLSGVGTITIANNTPNQYYNPVSTVSTQTITLPASPYDGFIQRIIFGGTIPVGNTVVTNCAIHANTGHTLFSNNFASFTANSGDSFSFIFNSSNNYWYVVS